MKHRIVFGFFLFSGFTSLVFEVIWARMLQQVFGTTSFAISTLLTAFMGGLALGSYLGGKLARRLKDPLKAYGIIEGTIGAYALLVPLFLAWLPTLYGLLFQHFLNHFYLFSLLRFVVVFGILLIPTTLMGATLPLVSQWIARHREVFQADVGFLYGANTLGACLGCFLAGFLLLPALGLQWTNYFFAGANFVLAAVVLFVAPRLVPARVQAEEDREESEESDELAAALGGPRARADAHPPWALGAILVAFGISGLVAMAYQVLWTRAYVITLGSSTYSFTLVLTAVLVGIAAGTAVISPFISRIRRPLFGFALTQIGVAAAATLSFLVIDRVPLWLLERIQEGTPSLGEFYFFQFGLVAVAVLLPSALQGMSFPLVIRAVTNTREGSGEEVGRAYAFNTGGAIVGAFVAGFLLLPALGLQGSVTLLVALNLAVGAGLAVSELTLRRRGTTAMALGLCWALAAGLLWIAPPMDPLRMTSGVFRVQSARDGLSARRLMEPGGELLYYADGLTATTTVERRGDTIVLKANGKPEASDTVDMPTQILVGLLPLLMRAELDGVTLGDEVAAMIGFGSGVTAGASLQWPLASLDVVEIEATMVEASGFFDHVNNRPLEDPRHLLVESDGRNYLEYVPKNFDVIVSEPSNPWIAGVSALFTEEFFQRVTTRLNDDGVYGQWVQLYELRPENVRRVFATFLAVFAHVHAFSSKAKSTDLILVGSMEPLVFGPESFAVVEELPRVAAELRRGGIEDPAELIGLLFMSERELREFAEGARVNTDDNGLLEFSAPFDLLHAEEGERFFAEFYFQAEDHGDPRPYLVGWPEAPGWTDEARAAVIRGVYLAGKPTLARAMLADRPPEVEGSVLAHLAAVLELAAGSLEQQVLPEELQGALGEFEARRFRRAEGILDELADEAWALADPGFLKLYGDTLYRRRRYRRALGVFEALESARSPREPSLFDYQTE